MTTTGEPGDLDALERWAQAYEDGDSDECDAVLALCAAWRAERDANVRLQEELDRQNSTTHALKLAAQVRAQQAEIARLQKDAETVNGQWLAGRREMARLTEQVRELEALVCRQQPSVP